MTLWFIKISIYKNSYILRHNKIICKYDWSKVPQTYNKRGTRVKKGVPVRRDRAHPYYNIGIRTIYATTLTADG